MNVMNSNMKMVSDFACEIRGYMEDATVAWKNVASAFAQALEMYGFKSGEFRELCDETGFSKSKAYKLAKIAECDRLKAHQGLFAAVESWTVLYAISSLKEHEFERLKEKATDRLGFAKHGMLTMRTVSACKDRVKQDREFSTYAVIKIDYKMLIAQKVEGQHVEDFEELLKDIEERVPYLLIEKTNVVEDAQKRYADEIQRKMIELARKNYNSALTAGLKRQKKHTHESASEHFSRVFNMNRDEARAAFAANIKNAFGHIGEEYDESHYWTEAQKIVDVRRDTIGETSKAWKDPFFHANTTAIMSASTSNEPTKLNGADDDTDWMEEFSRLCNDE